MEFHTPCQQCGRPVRLRLLSSRYGCMFQVLACCGGLCGGGGGGGSSSPSDPQPMTPGGIASRPVPGPSGLTWARALGSFNFVGGGGSFNFVDSSRDSGAALGGSGRLGGGGGGNERSTASPVLQQEPQQEPPPQPSSAPEEQSSRVRPSRLQLPPQRSRSRRSRSRPSRPSR